MMKRLLRMFGSAGSALAITVSLVLLMTHLISAPTAVAKTATTDSIHFGELIRPVEPPAEDPPEPPEPPEPAEQPSQPQAPAAAPIDRPDSGADLPGWAPETTLARLGPPDGLTGPAGKNTGLVTGLQPTVRLQPMYPRKAALQGQEGWVRIRFEVGADGRVLRAWVVDAQPARIFDREALRAVEKWRFAAPQTHPLVGEQTIEFSLDG